MVRIGYIMKISVVYAMILTTPRSFIMSSISVMYIVLDLENQDTHKSIKRVNRIISYVHNHDQAYRQKFDILENLRYVYY